MDMDEYVPNMNDLNNDYIILTRIPSIYPKYNPINDTNANNMDIPDNSIPVILPTSMRGYYIYPIDLSKDET